MDMRETLLKKYKLINTDYDKMESFVKEMNKTQRKLEELAQEENAIRIKWGLADYVIAIVFVVPIIALGQFFLYGFFQMEFENWHILLGTIALIILLYSLSTILVTFSHAKLYRVKNNIMADEYHVKEMLPLEEKVLKINNEMMKLESSPGIRLCSNEVPEPYRSKKAILFFIKALENRRADTEKELFNLYEEELHHERLEKIKEDEFKRLEQSILHCPVCGDTNCTVITETETYGKGFGVFKACCGYIMLGPIGILCGACGSGYHTDTETFWICGKCGHKFKK